MNQQTRACDQCGFLMESTTALHCLPCTLRLSIAEMTALSVTGGVSGKNRSPKSSIAEPSTKHLTAHSDKAPPANKKKLWIKRKEGPLTSLYKSSGQFSGLRCFLCNEPIPAGKLLEHKRVVHGEREVRAPLKTAKRSQWVSVVQGGLPSLGKRRK